MTVARAVKILNVSHPTARQAVKILKETGILQEVTGREWGRIYQAAAISRAIEKPE